MGRFSKTPHRRFTVLGRARFYAGQGDYETAPGITSITLRAHNHDDAEAKAKASFRRGDCEFFPDRYLIVDQVVEHRPRR